MAKKRTRPEDAEASRRKQLWKRLRKADDQLVDAVTRRDRAQARVEALNIIADEIRAQLAEASQAAEANPGVTQPRRQAPIGGGSHPGRGAQGARPRPSQDSHHIHENDCHDIQPQDPCLFPTVTLRHAQAASDPYIRISRATRVRRRLSTAPSARHDYPYEAEPQPPARMRERSPRRSPSAERGDYRSQTPSQYAACAALGQPVRR